MTQHTVSKTTHTPGPWRLASEDCGIGIRWSVVKDQKFNGMDVLVPLGTEANARLIAASPDLLAACDELLKADEYAESVWVTLDDHMNRAERRRILTAAIAKARGQ